MPLSLPGVPFKLTPEDMGQTDIASAIMRGMQVGYAPRTLEADYRLKQAEANSKNAYSNLMYPQAIMKLVGKPEVFLSLPKEVRDPLIGVLGGFGIRLNNSNQFVGANGQVINPDENGSLPVQNSRSSINGNLPSNEEMNPSVINTKSYKGTPLPTENAPDSFNADQATPFSQGNNSPDFKNNFYKTLSDMGSAKSLGEAKGKSTNDLLTESADSSNSAQNLVNLLDRYHSVYKNSTLKGPLLGYLAKFGPESAQLPTISTEMTTALASKLFGNKTSNYKEQLASNLKLNARQPEITEQKNYETFSAAANREKLEHSFYLTAQNMGIKDKDQMQELWNAYNRDVPFYDYKNNRPIEGANDVSPEDFANFIQSKYQSKSNKGSTVNPQKLADPFGWR